ncbi:MAG: class II fructose-bisphosphate aldolase [Eubacteriales bacterium]|jgi:fructose/tagatose bisphosphate aldolase
MINKNANRPSRLFRCSLRRYSSDHNIRCRKINIDTDIRQTFIETLRHILESNPDEIDSRKILGPARQAAVEMLKEKMSLFGSAGKAGKIVL